MFLNNKSFTLLEMILNLFVISVITLIIMIITLTMATSDTSLNNTRNLTLFKMQLFEDIFISTDIDVEYNNLELNTIDKDHNIIYKYKNNKIIRTSKNLGGQEVALNNVDNARFIEKEDMIYLEIKFKNEKQKRKTFITKEQDKLHFTNSDDIHNVVD